MRHELDAPYWALRLAIGLTAFLAGLDKFFDLLANWNAYLNPLALSIVPVSAATFMRSVGVVEMAVGLVVLSGRTRIGAYVASAWLLGIALNLLTMGRFLDIAVRDVGLSVAAFTLARLAEVREPARDHVGARSAIPGSLRSQA